MTDVLIESDAARGRYVQRIQAGSHQLLADEAAPTGNDLGPDPYALLLASLGACTAMTLQMYADHKKWPLESVKVRMSYERVHAEDCVEGEEVMRRVHRIERELSLEGDLSDEQRERLVQIAERCPIHRTLTEENEILTTLTPA